MRSAEAAIVALATVASVTACGAGQSQAQMPTANTTEETVNYTVPNVTAAPGSAPETQQEKGLIMAVVPTPFRVSDQPRKDCVPGPEQSSGLLGGLIKVNNGQVQKKPYVVTTQTGIDYEPKTLAFQIKVTNHTTKVMKLEGAYLKLNINGADVMLSDGDLKKFHDAILLPNDSRSFIVVGPAWGRHGSEDAIITFQGITLPNEFDNAGTMTASSNLSWTFRAKLESRQAKSKKTVENLMLDPAEAAALNCHPGAVAAN